jgi:release factor glutamine methyltransferase
LRAAGVENPRGDARLLLAAALGCSRETVMAYPERPVPEAQAALAAAYIDRRAAREPVSRILGAREFWSLPFAITPAVLDPRADSETLVEAVLAAAAAGQPARRLLDLGTGSGCLLLALLNELPRAWGAGLDRSFDALAAARANAKALGMAERTAFLQGNWCDALGGPWDIIVSNPPYVASGDIEALAPEVRLHDPYSALDGGGDGLAAYRALVPAARRALPLGGLLALELGAGQADAVRDLLQAAGFGRIEGRQDLAGVVRCLLAWA